MTRPKAEVRRFIWDSMVARNIGAFPFPLHNRIPNFIGCEAAANRLAEHQVFKSACALLVSPDSPQAPVRRRALMDGKLVFMSAPRLANPKCFWKLDPSNIPRSDIHQAATIKGAGQYAVPILPEEMPKIDLIVAGSVAARAENGARLGKGAGYSDLEFAIASKCRLLHRGTVKATTIHDFQVVQSDFAWDVVKHDAPLDFIFTPSCEIDCRPCRHDRPTGIFWELVSEDMRRRIPILRLLWEQAQCRGASKAGVNGSDSAAQVRKDANVSLNSRRRNRLQ